MVKTIIAVSNATLRVIIVQVYMQCTHPTTELTIHCSDNPMESGEQEWL